MSMETRKDKVMAATQTKQTDRFGRTAEEHEKDARRKGAFACYCPFCVSVRSEEREEKKGNK